MLGLEDDEESRTRGTEPWTPTRSQQVCKNNLARLDRRRRLADLKEKQWHIQKNYKWKKLFPAEDKSKHAGEHKQGHSFHQKEGDLQVKNQG